VRFIEVAYALFLERFPQTQAVEVTSKNEFTSAYGLGSSSASTVAFLAAVADFYGVSLDNFTLFDLAYRTVLQAQGMASGFDLAAAIWGGTLLYQKPNSVGEPPVVEPLDISVSNLPFLVGYTGIKADTATLIAAVMKLREQQPEQVQQWFEQISQLVQRAKQALLGGDLPELGVLLNQNQELLRQLGVSSPELERLIQASLQAGAYGAKLSGAGGGDCMIALVDSVRNLAAATAIAAASGTIIDVHMHAAGVSFEEI
jgi:mevalonate kinase